MKHEKIYRALLLVAALLVQSAAIDTGAAGAASAQSKRNQKRTSDASGGNRTTAPPAQEATTAPPASGKANTREATPDAPSPSATAPSQSPAKANAQNPKWDRGANVRYAYEFNQPNFVVRRVLIEHDATGRGQISFARKDSEELFTDPLQISPVALTRILSAWEALRFLDSDASYQDEKQFPHLGTMTLSMKQGTRERKAEFNWTHDANALALVKEYRGIGEQQIFIFDVTLARQYQPSEAVKLFKRLESLLQRDELSDTAPLVPLLRDLITDERIPLMARNHAARLLKKIEK
ncbi:MAG TPA: hypothetical protein VGW12_03640 [Pyrinomonadaceae bacterium]|nr:hypothetical protein [Pyrinomonadaceae bacterium]